MESEQAAKAAATVGIFVFLFFWVIVYLFFAFCLANMARKMGKPFGGSFIMAIIPIANLILFCQMADKPVWWFILLCIPLVNIVIAILIWMAIAQRLGRPDWWGIIIGLVPFVNLIFFLILAFAPVPAQATAPSQPTTPPPQGTA